MTGPEAEAPAAPGCTYRVQLHAGFTFDDAAAIAGYIADLGVTHMYCSPYLWAQAGSTHGYDVVDPTQLNPELGGDEGHARLVSALGHRGLGQVLDIVPNHMATDGRANRWWWDVLENGPSSPYASYFDVDWSVPDDPAGRVLVPILGDHIGRVLEAGEIAVERDGRSFLVRYHEHLLPLSPRTLDEIIAAAAKRTDDAELTAIADALARLPGAWRTDPTAVARRHRDKEVLGDRLSERLRNSPEAAASVAAAVKELNADVDRLDALLRRQNYRLAFWRTASEELDYRRFFNIDTLAGLRVEHETVFDDTHRLVLGLVEGGVVEGLRVDHVDGLRDPEGYLDRLDRRSGHRWIVVEKILESDEPLPERWPVAGTSGYDFLNRVNELFVDPANQTAMTEAWERFTGVTAPYGDIVHDAKQQIMGQELVAEVDRLTQLLRSVCERHRRHRDHTRRDLVRACRAVLAAFSVYRTYVASGRPVRDADREVVLEAVRSAGERDPSLDPELLTFMGEVLLLEHEGAAEHEFAVRFQQVSAPVMAKGVEDTAFYRYHRLISLNEVGGDPERFGGPVERFHDWCRQTSARWPETMLTLSTHDTKRSGDVRARLNLLSELPAAWAEATARWRDRAHRHRCGAAPDRAVEYLLYQTIVGAWPIEAGRLERFLEKATKEAKLETSWIRPDPDYDTAVRSFAGAVVGDGELVADVEAFLSEHRLVARGRINALAQTALLLTCPGVPDIYQGTELWDHSLVDPDNRRPVDYAARRALLDAVRNGEPVGPGGDGPRNPGRHDPLEQALARADEGAPKLWLIHRLLSHRVRHPDLYRSAGYHIVDASGTKASHVVAFGRDDRLVVVVPRLVVGLDDDWSDTSVELGAGRWHDVLAEVEVHGGRRAVADLLTRLPVCVLARER